MFVRFFHSDYFPQLMNTLRSHIVSRATVLLLCCGFMLCLARPVHAGDRAEAFADWLSSVMNEAEDDRLREELSRLKYADLDFHQLVDHASEIVSRHNEDFNLPIGDAASARIYQVLLTGWDQFQTGNAMSSVPVPQIKNQVLLQTHTLSAGFPLTAHSGSTLPAPRGEYRTAVPASFPPVPALMPMVDAIAINAP